MISMEETPNTCLWCHIPLTGRRKQAKYCSESHRVMYARRQAKPGAPSANGSAWLEVLQEALTLLEDLLAANAPFSGDGQRMSTLCLGCERFSHANPHRPCQCVCHAARRFLAD